MNLTFSHFTKTALLVGAMLLATVAQAQTETDETSKPCITWHVDAVTEGQWNMKNGSVNWANLLSASVDLRTWRGGSLEVRALATGQLKDGIADDLQDFSNINAESRAFRLTHLGIGQQIAGKLYVYFGLRQADEDYFNTDGAGIFTGSSYGCSPQAGENFAIGVYPEAALGLHLEYNFSKAWTIKTSIYSGVASDRLNRQFRFNPKEDGMVNLGSVIYSPTNSCFLDNGGNTVSGFLTPTYVLGYVAGWQYIEDKPLEENFDVTYPEKVRRSGGALWAIVNQPVARIGNSCLNLFATGGMRIGQFDTARGHWAAALMLGNVTHRGGTLAMGVSNAYYADNVHETDFETTFEFPLLSRLSLQPALHVIRTDNATNVMGNLRFSISLGND